MKVVYIYKSKINKFSLCLVATNEIKKTIVYLKTNRSLGRGVQMRILKESDFWAFEKCRNHSIEKTIIFPSSLKLGNITPIFKKDYPLDKSNYRPVSMLPLLSKFYERIINNQLAQQFEQFWNSVACGFRKTRST